MANQDRPQGALPVKHINGSPYNQQTNTYVIMAADTNAYFVGDFVKSTANGDTKGVPAVIKAAAGNTLRGVIVAIEPNLTDLSIMTIPATKLRDYYVEVSDSPDVVYEMQVNNTVAFLVTDLNKNANFVVAVPGTVPPNAYSATEVDAATIATTQAHPLKLMGVVQRADVDLTADTKVLVVINQHELMGNTAGV